MENRTCQGYAVIDSIRVGEVEIVLAHNPNAVSRYVTWKAYKHSNFQDFNHGNYFSDERAARADMFARAEEAAQYLPTNHHDKKKISCRRNTPDRER